MTTLKSFVTGNGTTSFLKAISWYYVFTHRSLRILMTQIALVLASRVSDIMSSMDLLNNPDNNVNLPLNPCTYEPLVIEYSLMYIFQDIGLWLR
jgi:hypothetical protein